MLFNRKNRSIIMLLSILFATTSCSKEPTLGEMAAKAVLEKNVYQEVVQLGDPDLLRIACAIEAIAILRTATKEEAKKILQRTLGHNFAASEEDAKKVLNSCVRILEKAK